MKRGFQDPSRKEPAGLCTIRRPKRDVSIDTLQAASIDSVSQASNDTIHHVSENTIHRGTIHPGTVHHVTVHPGTVHRNTIHRDTIHRGTIHRGTVHHNTIHPSIVHRDTIHRNTIYLPSIDTVHPVSVDTIHIPSIDTVHLVSVATVHLPSINTVHIPSLDTVHTNTVHPNTVHRDNVHPNTVHPNIVHRDTVHPNTFHRNTVHRNTIHQNTIHRGIVPPMTNTSYGETEKVEALILKIYKKGIWRDDEGRPCSLTGQLINAEGIMISMSQILDFIYSEENGDIGTPTTHVKQPYIQVHHADESKQKDELNREKLVNHDTVEDDEYHVSGEQSKVEEADIKDPTSASIDSKMIDTDFCHRSIPLEIPERSSCPQGIANSTQESIDESSCDLTSDVDKVTLKDFLELEEWLRQKLDDQPASGKGLENSLKADDIDRHQPDEIDQYTPCIIDPHPTYAIDRQSPHIVNLHTPDCIARYPPDCIDRHPCLDELSGYPIEPGPIEEIMHMSTTSHIDVSEHLRPPICAEEAVGICKRVKRIHDPVKIMVPCAVFEVESPIPPDKDEVDNCPGEVPLSDISKSKLIDTNTSSSINTDQIPSIDTRRESEQNEYELCGNIFYGDTTTHSDKSGGKKWRNWKKRERINGGSQLSLILHFSDDARKSRVRLHKSVGKNGRNWKKRKRTKRGSQLPLTSYFSDNIRKPRVQSRCFSQPFAKLKALLIAEMIDKGEWYMEEAFTQE
ncbi:hypothetical protein IGI04_007403 [Brassica rapa subsp. trilocularis]|uniref:Uncharacterized protein n=1 Tax=Brassica rapa subsp. trilocularis TaxID=1813537 RepID=A0ABQ7NJR7_BRACM|nr:hypothetical protein IGI04_007403 [Brassica rapa subsp. trilocularis]